MGFITAENTKIPCWHSDQLQCFLPRKILKLLCLEKKAVQEVVTIEVYTDSLIANGFQNSVPL
jgi:hypothetical protein